MRLLLCFAVAGLTTTAAFAQSTKPEQAPPPDRSSSTNSGSTSDVGVSVDVGKLFKGLVKAVRKPPPGQEPGAPVLPAQDAITDAGSGGMIEAPAPIETALPATPAVPPPDLVPAPAPEASAQATPAPARAARPGSAPPLEPLTMPPPPLAPPVTPAPTLTDRAAPTPLDPAPETGASPVSPSPRLVPARPSPSKEKQPILLMLAAMAIVAAGAAAWWRQRRIISHTRSLLSLSPRLEFPEEDLAAGSLRFAGPPVAIRARLDTGPRHG